MKLLDYNVMPSFLSRYFGTNEQILARTVGPDSEYCSDYYDIVRFYGDRKIDPKQIRLNYLDEPFSLDDPLIQSFAKSISNRLSSEGRIYDGPQVMKLVDADLETPQFRMIVQPVDYRLKAGSCFALDCKDRIWSEFGGTLREYYKLKSPTTSLIKNPLAICLGVCGLLIVKQPSGERSLLIVYRSGNLASLEHSYGPSAAGSIDWSKSASNLYDLCLQSLSSEIVEELHLPIGSFEVTPLAYTREIFRGEQPHLFCLIEADISMQQVENCLISIEGEREFERFLFMPLDHNDCLSSDNISQLNHETKMNYYLLREYFRSTH